MGWNRWNMFGSTVNAAVIKQTADAFVETGVLVVGSKGGGNIYGIPPQAE